MNMDASCALALFGSLAVMGSPAGAVKGMVRKLGSWGVPAGQVRVGVEIIWELPQLDIWEISLLI